RALRWRPVVDDDDLLERAGGPGHGLVEWEERSVHEEEAVLRVVGDVADLARVEAEVQRVEDAAVRRRGEVELHVASVVPRQRGDAIARPRAQAGERVRELRGAAVEALVRRAVDGS